MNVWGAARLVDVVELKELVLTELEVELVDVEDVVVDVEDVAVDVEDVVVDVEVGGVVTK
jgi:hypothetical protein